MISVEHRPECAGYSSAAPFHPSCVYPEYPWAELSLNEPNPVYDMLRALFLRHELDLGNADKPSWNPLGKWIKPGMTVLLKPNMVLNWHPAGPENKLDCLITHPSLVRAVMDYVVIALQGSGRILLGDAALQSCDFADLLENQGYRAIQAFYASNGIEMTFVDFRQVASVYNEHGILETVQINGDPLGYKVVNMKDWSAHLPVRFRSSRFRVTNYDHNKMAFYHTEKHNSYLIAATPLAADVVISLPKLKVHRKAGMTSSLKNFVGIIGHKDCLPHHTRNSKDEGGDEYLQENFWKRRAVTCIEWMNVTSVKGWGTLARSARKLAMRCLLMAEKKRTDPFCEGSWYGNDTIWRTTLDLVRIIRYANKDGLLQTTPQRRVLAVVDAIVAGEGEGPLHPTPKKANFLALGDDLPEVDYAMAVLMGLDPQALPTVREAFTPHALPLTAIANLQAIELRSNNPHWDRVSLQSLAQEHTLQFTPPAHWKGHVERDRLQNKCTISCIKHKS